MNAQVLPFKPPPSEKPLTLVVYEETGGDDRGVSDKVSVDEVLTSLRGLVSELEALRDNPHASAWIIGEIGRLRIVGAR